MYTTIIGFGKQGNKAVRGIPSSGGIKKLYAGSSLEDFPDDEEDQRWYLDFHYELGAWDPEFEIKMYLRNPKNQEMLLDYFQDTALVVIVMGLGGTLSMAAKHVITFLRNEDIPVYVVCSQPFHSDGDYLRNLLCNEMVHFLRKNSEGIGWTLIESEKLVKEDRMGYKKAYETAHALLTDTVMTVLALPGEDEEENLLGTKIMMNDLVSVIDHDLVYLSFVELKREKNLTDYEILNRFLPYLPDKHSEGLLVMEIPKDVESILEVGEKMNEILDYFSGVNNFTCRLTFSKRELTDETYKCWFVCNGKETEKHKISLQEISLF